MPTNFNTPFNAATRSGKSPWQTVQNIAWKNNATPNQVCTQLNKKHTCFTKPFNGHKFCIPTNFKKSSRTNSKNTEFYFWQHAIEFAIQQGWVTPEQVYCWSNQQLFGFLCTKFNQFYSKPANFNPNKKVAGFPANWFNGSTGTSTSRSKTKKNSAKKRKTRKNSRKRTTKRATARRKTTRTATKTRRPRRARTTTAKARRYGSTKRASARTTRSKPKARRYSKTTSRPTARRRVSARPRLRLVGGRPTTSIRRRYAA